MTEAEVLAILRRHYVGESDPQPQDATMGNGALWSFVTHVRNQNGTAAERTIDAVAWGMWRSRGLSIHAHEVKCSRSDVRAELRNPAKADAFFALCDFFWLVLAHESFIQPGELPETWGLMVVRGGRVHVKREAPRLRPVGRGRRAQDALPPGMGRSSVAALLCAAVRTKASERADLAAVREAGRREGMEQERALAKHSEEAAEEAHAKLAVIEKMAGTPLAGRWVDDAEAERVGRALRHVLAGEEMDARVQQRLGSFAQQLRELADVAEAVRDGRSDVRGRGFL